MNPLEQPSYRRLHGIVSERTTPLLAWVGSGLSVPAGLPDWSDLRQRVSKEAREQLATLEDDTGKKRRLDLARRGSIEADLWVAFDMLHDSLGPNSYSAAIRSQLDNADRENPPLTYTRLWQIGFNGLLTTNLDRFSIRSFAGVKSDSPFCSFEGKSAAQRTYLLKKRTHFVANLHGYVDDQSSWVFRKSELRTLMEQPGYRSFIQTCFASHTVVFLGVSADDSSAGGLLRSLTDLGVDCGSHFWITDRRDSGTDDWAQEAGVELIRYDASGGDHSGLMTLLDDLRNARPTEAEAPPVVLSQVDPAGESFLPPDQLIGKTAEELRKTLNGYAKSILQGEASDAKLDEYKAFRTRYESLLHQAWYIPSDPEGAELLGYTIQERIKEGSFGAVYRAEDAEGQPVAIKVLHHRILHNLGMFNGFRRGVQSMRILAERKVKGIVPYIDAAEIPTLAVMDYVSGYDLEEAVHDQPLLSEWPHLLYAAEEILSTIRRSHELPERVLHRDIRPPNIMIRDAWSAEREDWEVVVLDFDLSWHKDASGQSIIQEDASSFYLAPEQVDNRAGQETRHAAVDAYGLGTTLYYLRTKDAPPINAWKDGEWSNMLLHHARKYEAKDWLSVSRRYFRMIECATRYRQSERWDVHRMLDEVRAMRGAIDRPADVRSAEMLAEEIACRALGGHYTWSDAEGSAVQKLPTGSTLSVTGNEQSRQIKVEVEWRATGNEQRSRVGSLLPGVGEKVVAELTRSGWEPSVQLQGLGLSVSGRVSCSQAAANLQAVTNGLIETNKAIGKLSF